MGDPGTQQTREPKHDETGGHAVPPKSKVAIDWGFPVKPSPLFEVPTREMEETLPREEATILADPHKD